MFHNNPYFKNSDKYFFIQSSLPVNLPHKLHDIIKDILSAMQLINTLRTLHLPTLGKSLDEDIDKKLRQKAADFLMRAASKTDREDLKNILSIRASSLLNQEYGAAAIASSKEKELPIELLIGVLPSWRYKGKPKTYSALLALPDYLETSLTDLVDLTSKTLINELCKKLNISCIEPSSTVPQQITCDLIALAGDFASHPIHIAHFLPEDEGHYDSSTYKTLVYRNLYITRYRQISIPLSDSYLIKGSLAHPLTDEELWPILSIWFRGHDIGHTYFDTLLKKMPGIDRRKRYALQEAMADIWGFLLAIKVLRTSNDSSKIKEIISVYLSEMCRYMTRDTNLFPDAKSAWFQFGYLMKEETVLKGESGYLTIKLEQVEQNLNELLVALIKIITKKETAYMESELEFCSNFNGNNPLTSFHFSSTKKEIDPIFINADTILSSNDSLILNPDLQRSSTIKYDDYDIRRRF